MSQSDVGKQARLRALPAVEKALADPALAPVLAQVPSRLAVRVVRTYLAEVRAALVAGGEVAYDTAELEGRLRREARPTLTRVVNGLGVVLHTGLGRAPLCRAAREALADVSAGFSSLEVDRETGRRGSRGAHVESLLSELTGAEAAHVVNNNCAATLLILSSMAAGREVVVSRGQLIEIGGAFRIPDVMKQSGCTMVEVGTTNRTHLRDYADAITPNTAALLRVHTSNYRIRGFTKEVGLDELVALGRERGVPVLDDLGSGALVDLARFGLPREPLVSESMAAGAAVACFSGDKLIGACQAGIIVGRKDVVGPMKKHPLSRALRLDKLSFAVLERTLTLFLDEPRALEEHVLYRILLKPVAEMQREAQALARRVRGPLGDAAEVRVRPCRSEFGGGALATESLESRAVAIRPKKMGLEELARRMRLHSPPVFGRIEDDEYLLDFRTLDRSDVPCLARALTAVLVCSSTRFACRIPGPSSADRASGK
ncbi:MAG TPA: L-seryl-tRNA(Sec) selenium transferase [candidate division WOR-3 bacterium]|uniref:L-seryl-tRNA(Sec) selenium transferase n=1 Tax=candidate division WOR-3 bacterium TaxID=2052148 RepID=A0A7V0XFF3_UNCW3|nr:L-seryl-tRNA(Sec) selenium transferase [candidate division WOR-3 bacterium]